MMTSRSLILLFSGLAPSQPCFCSWRRSRRLFTRLTRPGLFVRGRPTGSAQITCPVTGADLYVGVRFIESTSARSASSRALIRLARSRVLGAQWADAGTSAISREMARKIVLWNKKILWISTKVVTSLTCGCSLGHDTQFQTVPTYSLEDISEYATQRDSTNHYFVCAIHTFLFQTYCQYSLSQCSNYILVYCFTLVYCFVYCYLFRILVEQLCDYLYFMRCL